MEYQWRKGGRGILATARGLEAEGSVTVEQRVNADSKNRFTTSLCHYINTIILGKLRVLAPTASVCWRGENELVKQCTLRYTDTTSLPALWTRETMHTSVYRHNESTGPFELVKQCTLRYTDTTSLPALLNSWNNAHLGIQTQRVYRPFWTRETMHT